MSHHTNDIRKTTTETETSISTASSSLSSSPSGIRSELLSLRSSLISRHRSAERPEIEHFAEPMDQTVSTVEKARIAHERELEVRQIKKIDDALAAIERGEYGVCVECEEPISEKRLKAVKWAVRCLGCQEKADRQAKED